MSTTRETENPQAISVPAARIRLAPCDPRHAETLFALLNDREVVRMLAVVPWPPQVEDTRRLMSEQTAGADNFVVTLSGEPIGVAGVKHPGSGDKPRVMPRLGYWIGRPYWGRGHATEAVGALVAEAFARFPDAQRIGAGVFEDNPASQRVLEKLGFERIGGYTLHCRARDNGVYTHDMNLTRERWASARAEGA